ncbi:MAG: DUF3352 domain-containing protein [Phycisphaerae bacterium]|jgi:hypothetical protein
MSPGTANNRIRRKFNCALLLFCCALGFLNTSASAKAKSLPKTAKLLPPETIVLLDIDDFQQLKSQFEKTNFYKFYADPAMTAFVEDAKVKWREKIQKLDDNDIFKAILSADIWPEGGVAAALVLNEQSKDFNEPPIVIITQWGEGIDKIKEAVDKMLKKNIEAGGHQKKSENYRGVRIEITIDEASATLNHCFIGDSFIAATDIDLLKFVIAHIKGSNSPALAEDSDYKAAMKTVGPSHDIDFYINIKQVVKTMLAEDPAGEARKWTADLGIDNVAALACSAAVGRSPGNSATTKAFIKINGAKKGICKMLEAESAGYNLPRFIPASAYSVTFFNLNIKKAYDELYNIAYSFNPQYAAMLQMLDLPDSPDGEPGMKLKTDVISHLGSQIVIARSVNKPFSNTTLPTESLVALVIDDRETIEKSLSLLHSKVLAAENPDARRELLGHTIYLLGQSAMPFLSPGMTPMQAGAAQQTPTLAFTVTDTHLIFASEAVIERAIRDLSSTEALSAGQAKWFTSAKQAIPSAVGIAALEDNAASGEIFWWTVKQNKAEPASAKFYPAGVSELVNFDLLPPFDAVRKYLGQSAFYGISTPAGFFFEFKDVNPAEL